MSAEVTRCGLLDMQVCVPTDWPDEQIKTFADTENPCGTTHGWSIRREGDAMLGGMPERNPCNSHDGFIHVILDA
jgi:hypothetical protein